jgi:hypothetical protein
MSHPAETRSRPPALSAEEKKRLAREKRDARLAAEGKTLGEGIAAAHGALMGEEGAAFERAFWVARRAGMPSREVELPE